MQNLELSLKKVHKKLLTGEENFYENIFADLKIPLRPVVWKADNNAEDFAGGIHNIAEIRKHGKAIQLINMFRVRGHLLANIDPLYQGSIHPSLIHLTTALRYGIMTGNSLQTALQKEVQRLERY